ncbi:hypothetical protein PILCRDRAFT_15309 [Piloderma croceum F 1598]|uniref:Uncharacterized protein n=1 Tax=Piloderma croceum (strain F 1598) TaxID=765440 RepID=A0A0C3EL60_PILCF|nr:hypothetical protein PILCRDRAFT_15309 [Piloderma croceum F 1598]
MAPSENDTVRTNNIVIRIPAATSSSSAPVASTAHPATQPSTKKAQIMRPSNSKTARNLYAIDYMREHPKATTTEFAAAFKELDDVSLKKYQATSRACKQELMEAEATV